MKRSLPILLLVLAAGVVTLVLAQGRSQARGEAWDADEVVTLDGVMTEVERPWATLESGGVSYIVHLGPAWYWDQAGYEIHAGDEVTIDGSISRDGDEIHLYPYSIRHAGELLRLADENGVPLWSGRGCPRESTRSPAAGCGHGHGCRGGCAGGCGRHAHRGHGCCRHS